MAYKPKYTCGTRTNSKCVFYDLKVPDYSNLIDEDCVVIEETTEDLYKLVSWLKESVDLEDFEDECLDLEKVKDTYKKDKNRFLVKDVLKELTSKICNLEESADDSNDDTLELDFKCLVSACGEPISSLKDLLQALIDEVCNLKEQS